MQAKNENLRGVSLCFTILHRLKQNVEFLGCVAEIKMNLYLNIIDRMGHSVLTNNRYSFKAEFLSFDFPFLL